MDTTLSAQVTVKLTLAQRSALECAGLDIDGCDEDEDAQQSMLLASWHGNVITFEPLNREIILRAITVCENSEDHFAFHHGDRGARGARTALSNLYTKIRRA